MIERDEAAKDGLGTRKKTAAILQDLQERPRHWLHHASQDMVDDTVRDWEGWRGSLTRDCGSGTELWVRPPEDELLLLNRDNMSWTGPSPELRPNGG